MLGNWRINAAVGSISFFFTFFLSQNENLFFTSVTRAFYSFVIVFMLMMVLQWVFRNFLNTHNTQVDEAVDDSHRGQHMDFTTPDEDDSFNKLNPPKLISKLNINPEEMAEALRHMKDE